MKGDNILESLQILLERTIHIAIASSVTAVKSKTTLDYVTNVDHTLDKILTDALPMLCNVDVLSEERTISVPESACGNFWLIDPLDGTHNFIAGLPHCAIGIALFRDGEVELAALADISTHNIFLARRGCGAWFNRKRLTASAPATLVGLSTGTMDQLMHRPDLYAKLREIGKLRNLGCQGLHLSYLAQGVFSLVASAEACIWDDAPGRLIAEEAGAIYRTFAPVLWSEADMQTPLSSVCGHSPIIEPSLAIFSELWANKNGQQ